MADSRKAYEYRKIGNQYYAKSKECRGIDDQRKLLYQALEWYEKARDEAGKDMDLLSSAYKNMGVCYATLETLESTRERELYYLKLTGRAIARALEYGEHAEKPRSWLDEVMRRLEETVNRYLMRSKELMEDAIDHILECVTADVGNQQYKVLISKHRIDQSERIINKSMELIYQRQYISALPKLRGVNYFIEEARRHGKDKPELVQEIEVLEEETVCFIDIAQGLQQYKLGEEVLESIKKTESTGKRGDLGLAALDHFKQTEIFARGQDVELVAMSQAKIGITLVEAFNCKERAQICFNEAINVSMTLFGNVHDRPWYVELTSVMERIQEEEWKKDNEKWENRRKPFLDELKPELEKLATLDGKSNDDMINFLWENFKPKHIEHAKKPEAESVKKRLLKANQLYNPDKIDEEKFGTKYRVLCEEILKLINQRYNNIKLED